MGVAEDFINFRSAYLIGKDQMESISYRYKRITKQLNTDFWATQSETAHSLYRGSYGRDTAARGVSDIDIYFELPSSVYQKYSLYQINGQSALLQAVRASMQNTYPTTTLKGDGQVVVVNFTDSIRFEILPGFLNQSNSVTFPDSNGGGSWKACDPRAEMAAFEKRNSETNHNLKAICRMARVWRNQHNISISGMLIDTIAYQFVASWPERDMSYLYHDWLVRDFFLHLSQVDPNQDWWKAPGSGSWVHRTGKFEARARAAHQAASDAIEHTKKGEPWAARQDWQLIFGTNYNA
jgi:hypothetical protein